MKKLHQFIVFTSLVSSLSCVGSELTLKRTQIDTDTSDRVYFLFKPISPESLKSGHPVSPIGPEARDVSPIGNPTPQPTKDNSVTIQAF